MRITDKQRLDWLEMQMVDVSTRLVYGSTPVFESYPEQDAEGEEFPSDIRECIDLQIMKESKNK